MQGFYGQHEDEMGGLAHERHISTSLGLSEAARWLSNIDMVKATRTATMWDNRSPVGPCGPAIRLRSDGLHERGHMRQWVPHPDDEVQRQQLPLVHVRLHRAEPRLTRRHLCHIKAIIYQPIPQLYIFAV